MLTGMSARASSALLLLVALACTDEIQPNPQVPPSPAQLTSLLPTVVVPGTRLEVQGKNLSSGVAHVLALKGSIGAAKVDRQLSLERLSSQRARVSIDANTFNALGVGKFNGTAQIMSRNTAGEARSNLVAPALWLKRYLTPVLTDAGKGLVHLNSPVTVLGAGLLAGAGEGTTIVARFEPSS